MEMRHGGGRNRFSKKQSGSEFTTKPKKRIIMLKKKQEEEMSYEFSLSDLETELSFKKKKKSKLLKKNLKNIGSNGVDHASIPRKLRSAMKKRNLESVSKLSSTSKRLNRSKTGLIKKDLIKKEDQEMEEAKRMMISNDEKEVAETLFGLAEMFNESDSIDKKKICCDPSCDEKETIKVVEETDFTADLLPSSTETKTKTDEMPLDQSEKQNGFVAKFPMETHAKADETNEMNYKSNGHLPLWPSLPSTIQSGSYALSKPFSTTKLPPWMDQAVSASPLKVEARKLNKCASHIYIARLIKDLQTSKRCNQNEQRSLPNPTITDFKSTVSLPNRYQNPSFLDLNRTMHNPKNVQEGMTQIALELYGPHTSQKQGYDFLSLSSSSQSHYSFPQYHLSPSTSSHQVLSPYQTGRLQTAYASNQQLQKRLWAAASSQYRPQTRMNINNIATPSSSNQYSKPNLSLNLTSNSIQPSQVAPSPRYNNNVSQQHRFMAAAMSMSNNSSRTVTNRQEFRFPLIYEDTRTPLQLICHEQS